MQLLLMILWIIIHFHIKSIRANLYFVTLRASGLGFLHLLVHTGTHFIMLISQNETVCGLPNQGDESTEAEQEENP